MAKVKSIEALRRELQKKESSLSKLQGRRNRIAAKLESLDRQIAGLLGEARRGRGAGKAVAAVAVEAKAPKAAKAARGKRGGRRRSRSEKPLLEYIKEVLSESGDGMRVLEITSAVKKAGYKSASKDFYGIVATAVRDAKNFKKLGRGVYKLA